MRAKPSWSASGEAFVTLHSAQAVGIAWCVGVARVKSGNHDRNHQYNRRKKIVLKVLI